MSERVTHLDNPARTPRRADAPGAARVTDSDRAAGAMPPEVEKELEEHRRELTGYCYRMLGSPFEAEDAVQDTMIRAWRGYARFQGRSSLRSWLYRIATNVCLDMLGGKERRTRPMDLASPSTADAPLGLPLPESTWITPAPDSRVLDSGGDPAEVAVARDSVRLAFLSALQRLPARQRAVLILREVLCWHADEVAELLGSSVASVNSALQRARATLASTESAAEHPARALGRAEQDLLARYVDAFERYDLDSLTALLHEDVRLSMPPYPLWMRGADQVRGWLLGTGLGCRGSRLVRAGSTANGSPTFGQYRRAASGSGHEPWSLVVVEISEGRISGLDHFLDHPRLFPLFGLPSRLDD